MYITPEVALKLLLAVAAGGLIGLEREFRDKAAGFRTMIFICVGATLFTMFSSSLAGDKDPTRIAAQIVSGVGFLGAGVIMRESGRIVGITTSAAIWLTAALGMGIGGGEYVMVGMVVLGVVIVLWVFPRIEHWIDRVHEERLYEIGCSFKVEKFKQLEDALEGCGLRIHSRKQTKTDSGISYTWYTTGALKNHQKFVRLLLVDPDIREFRF